MRIKFISEVANWKVAVAAFSHRIKQKTVTENWKLKNFTTMWL
jgi:hypothetical protein